MIFTFDQVYRIISGAIFIAFGGMLIFVLKNTYQLDLGWEMILSGELAAGVWGAIYGYPILSGKLAPPSQRLTQGLIILAILTLLIGFIVVSIAFFGLASIARRCNSYVKLGKYSSFIALKVSLDGILVAGLSLLTGSLFFLLLVTPFLELGFWSLLDLPVGWLMIIVSLDYSGVWLAFPLSVLASWTLYFLGLRLRSKIDFR